MEAGREPGSYARGVRGPRHMPADNRHRPGAGRSGGRGGSILTVPALISLLASARPRLLHRSLVIGDHLRSPPCWWPMPGAGAVRWRAGLVFAAAGGRRSVRPPSPPPRDLASPASRVLAALRTWPRDTAEGRAGRLGGSGAPDSGAVTGPWFSRRARACRSGAGTSPRQRACRPRRPGAAPTAAPGMWGAFIAICSGCLGMVGG